MDELTNQIEAILYASGKGVSESNLADYCQSKPAKISKALKELQENLLERNGSLLITEHNDKWKLTVRGKYTQLIQDIVSETELPNPVLKTLAVVAYRSPVMQAEVVNMRGQSAYEHIKLLVKEKFITKDESGRTFILKITEKFYNYFDVEGDEEIREIFANLRKEQQKITELEIIAIEKGQDKTVENAGDQQKLGNLAIIDVNEKTGNETNTIQEQEIQPRVKEKTEEEKKEEESFLNDIDKKIEEISKRIGKQELPKREMDKEKEEEDPLKELEKLAETEEKSEENYL